MKSFEPLNDEIFIDSRKFMWIKFLILFAHCWFYLGNLSLSHLPLKHSTQVSNIQANFNNRKIYHDLWGNGGFGI
jgi:hypothetical protein